MKAHNLLTIIFLLSACRGMAQPQQGNTLEALRRAAAEGRQTELRDRLPAIEDRYRGDPGYVYLQGLAESDGDRAIRHYQIIVDQHSRSEWADDALWRLYQYSSALGAYDKADAYMARLQTEYPASPLLRSAAPKHGSAPEADLDDRPRYAVQIGAFRHAEQAEELAEQMRSRGYLPRVVEKIVGPAKLSAVWIGEYETREAAKNAAMKLKTRYAFDGLVVRSR